MNIPKYWAQQSLEVTYGDNQTTTLRRFGWSNDSKQAAIVHAVERCDIAAAELHQGEDVRRIEPQYQYIDDTGIPIREEWVKAYPELNCIATINSYGATCLNAAHVMILDIDHTDLKAHFAGIDPSKLALPSAASNQKSLEKEPLDQQSPKGIIASKSTAKSTSDAAAHNKTKSWSGSKHSSTSQFSRSNQSATPSTSTASPKQAPKQFSVIWLLPGILIAGVPGILFGLSLSVIAVTIVVLLVVGWFLLKRINKAAQANWLISLGGYDGMIDMLLADFLANQPPASKPYVFNVYQTPYGYRLIALQDTFKVNDAAVQHCFEQLPVDKKYVRLCKAQQCFRARVTAKPWHTEIEGRLPSKDFWHTTTDAFQARQAWLAQYHQLTPHYAACHFYKTLGEGTTHPEVAKVVALHDELCQSQSATLPLG